ncbi:BTB/POZ domain protein [Teladorsagia circumcincta]|uniref:BTB/POZ domain protein n=1 Tax=Teladorsagia circumcincta TaxID=45464 RepID=A0A2G9U4A7_TELCI|nr:BTB/POZ domain protein [Teladorsagia circumcincta]
MHQTHEKKNRFNITDNDDKVSDLRITLCTEDDDDIICIDQKQSLFFQAFASLNDLRCNGQLCDIVLVVEGRRISAHKVVLAASIPYFRVMFTTEMLEANQTEVVLQDLNYDTLEQLVSFAYCGELRISAGNVQSIMIGANFLQLDGVAEKCAEYLQTRLHPSNALAIRAFCSALGCRSVVSAADRFVQKHFVSVCRSDEFVQLSVDDVVELLCMDGLYVESEEAVFEAAFRWIQHDLERRKKFASRLLACVRLPLLKPSFLADQVAGHQLVRGDLACRDLVDEAKDYHLIPERRPYLRSFRTKARCCNDVPGLMFAIGGLSTGGDSLSTVEMYDPLTKRWTPVRSMTSFRSRVGIAVHDRKIYAIGGFNGHDRLKIVESYDYNKNEWTPVAPLTKKRSALAAAFFNNKLYVCGGYDGITSLATVEVYCPEKNTWELGESMTKQRSAAGVAVLDGYLYVMGGHDGMSIFSSVERFSPEKGQWEAVPSMLSKRCRLGATTLNGKIYVCGGYDGAQFLNSVECFDPVTMRWTPVTPMNIKRSRVSLVSNANSIYAIAGYDGMSNLSSMEVYREETDQWELSTPLGSHEGGVGVGVIPIPPNMLAG